MIIFLLQMTFAVGFAAAGGAITVNIFLLQITFAVGFAAGVYADQNFEVICFYAVKR